MNRYILIRRLFGPAFLLLVGVLALLAQAEILSWSKSWPLFLILLGVLKLAERAALAADQNAIPPTGPSNVPYAPQYPAPGMNPIPSPAAVYTTPSAAGEVDLSAAQPINPNRGVNPAKPEVDPLSELAHDGGSHPLEGGNS